MGLLPLAPPPALPHRTVKDFGAEERTRTSNPLRGPAPKAGAYTSSATSAHSRSLRDDLVAVNIFDKAGPVWYPSPEET